MFEYPTNSPNAKFLAFPIILAALLIFSPVDLHAERIYGVTINNQLINFDSATPGTVSAPVAITGLGASEQILGIDFRPATPGVLVGIGSSGSAYSINLANGAATSINSGIPLSGTAFGVDFNPVPNALRIVSNTGHNLRITAGGTGVINTDASLNPGTPSVVGAAYSNNVPGGIGGVTTLYVIDSLNDQLLTQGSINSTPTSPNTGTLFPIGSLGFNTSDLVGFDISGASGIAFASLTAPAGIASQLFTINLGTGAATLVGGIGGGSTIRGLSVSNAVAEPATLGLMLLGLFGFATKRGWRRQIQPAEPDKEV